MKAVPADEAIVVEPLSPAVGLEVRGASLDAPSDELSAMVSDLWQVGGALLFRNCADPTRGAAALGRAIAGNTLITVSAAVPGGTDWMMVGADTSDPPPLACIVGTETGNLPALWLAGMEAAADAMRLTGADTLAEAQGLHFAHSLDGPMLPIVQKHPVSGATAFYPPPRRAAATDPVALAIVRMAEEPQFCHRHDWQPGDLLAWDPRVVRSMWTHAPAEKDATFAIVRTAAPQPMTRPEWEMPL